jgi:hypothetical protein
MTVITRFPWQYFYQILLYITLRKKKYYEYYFSQLYLDFTLTSCFLYSILNL